MFSCIKKIFTKSMSMRYKWKHLSKKSRLFWFDCIRISAEDFIFSNIVFLSRDSTHESKNEISSSMLWLSFPVATAWATESFGVTGPVGFFGARFRFLYRTFSYKRPDRLDRSYKISYLNETKNDDWRY